MGYTRKESQNTDKNFGGNVVISGTLDVTGLATLASGSSIGTLTLADGSITDSSGAISFGSEDLSTTGTIDSGALTATDITGDSLDIDDVNINNHKISITATNEDLELEANGTGEIVANSNFTGKAVEGAIQHKYSGSLKTAANYDIADNEGFILTSSGANSVDLDLPSAGSYLGREIIINTGNASNSTTVTCDGPSNKILGTNGTAYDTCTLTGISKFVRLVATNGIYWQVTSQSDTGVTFS